MLQRLRAERAIREGYAESAIDAFLLKEKYPAEESKKPGFVQHQKIWHRAVR